MKRIQSTIFITALALSLSGLAFAQGGTPADTSKTKESPAEEKKETPAQEKAEEKSEAKAHPMAHKMAKTPAVDINSASKEDLMKLSGVTEDVAEKIIGGRPYTSRAQLLSKKIVTAAEYRKIRAKVTAKK